jgi:hypoxanthine-DNA glycosylase
MTLKRSFPPVVDGRTRVLILGSLPGEVSLAQGRYYAHPRNHFWHLLGGVIGAPLATMQYERRLMALLAAHVGLWDMVAGATRSGSLDQNLREIAANDLPGLIATLPDLRCVAFNGQKAASLGQRLVPSGLGTVVLPSSSPAHTLALVEKARHWGALAAFLDGHSARQ